MNLRKAVKYSLPPLVLVAAAIGAAFWTGSDGPAPVGQMETSAQAPARDMSAQTDVRQEKTAPEISPTVSFSKNPEKDEIEIPEGVRFQMADIAEAYRDNMRYPKYSKPLRENDWALLNPRAFIPRETPLNNKEGLSAAMILARHILNRMDDLPVDVIIKGQDDAFYANAVDISLSSRGEIKPLMSLDEKNWDENTSIYTGIIPAASLKGAGPGDVTLIAEISFGNGEEAKISTVVNLYENTATLTHLDEAYVDGADLVIPAHLEVKQSGHYRIRANLFDESTGQPVSHLNSVFKLNEASNTCPVKVHASALRNSNAPGPYFLTDINITKSPSTPGDKTGYGSSSSDFFIVQGFDLNSYSDEEYENPQNKQRLEFLQRLASGGE